MRLCHTTGVGFELRGFDSKGIHFQRDTGNEAAAESVIWWTAMADCIMGEVTKNCSHKCTTTTCGRWANFVAHLGKLEESQTTLSACK